MTARPASTDEARETEPILDVRGLVTEFRLRDSTVVANADISLDRKSVV